MTGEGASVAGRSVTPAPRLGRKVEWRRRGAPKLAMWFRFERSEVNCEGNSGSVHQRWGVALTEDRGKGGGGKSKALMSTRGRIGRVGRGGIIAGVTLLPGAVVSDRDVGTCGEAGGGGTHGPGTHWG